MASVGGVVQKLFGEYDSKTPKRLKIIDAYLTYILLTGIVQFAYCCLVGTFPFNSFLSGFISSVASFVLAGQYPQLTVKHSNFEILYENANIDLPGFCVF
jgi:MFS superfamily sulfate permease-like transporter